MNNVQNKRFDFAEQQVVTFVVETGVSFQLSLQVGLVVLKFALLDSIHAVDAEVDHFG